ncbi:hypothetical protein F4556_000510 [Kitasatospora gansuensis]|uniref:Uncharacterized protein n=1 Tax=Kitasatospora gansuensis TaxID=258050 RepID=A0A7W7S6T4_9ACTN|nr:hypothetical protein [Kitasatospora gansuensis]
MREFAVPPTMIEAATARRHTGDWAGACAAAAVDIDFGLRHLARTHGRELMAEVRADLRHLAPDLLRWHLPRIAPDGLLRPGLTVELARYRATGPDGDRPVHLVARTPPAWADAGQRISLGLWDSSQSEAAGWGPPHPRPHRRFRLDLHRHLWDARRADELRIRSGADAVGPPAGPEPAGLLPPGYRCAVDRWAAEAAILLRAEGRSTSSGAGAVGVRLGARHRLVLELGGDVDGPGPSTLRIAKASPDRGGRRLPVLPDAATWVLPDLDLLRAGLIEADRLHPLVASALVPGRSPTAPSQLPSPTGQPQLVECQGSLHRIGMVDGVLAPLDHDPAEIRREELLVALSGTPMPCLQAIDLAHRHPDCLVGVRERLDHGDIAGALAVVEGLLGPDALLRSGDLRDELETAAHRRISYGLFRAGLAGSGPGPHRDRTDGRRSAERRSRPRHALTY